MTDRLKRLVFLCLALVAAPVFAHGQTPDARTEVTGRVLDASTHEPLRKALVSIRALSIETVTDDQGRFRLAGAPAGDVELYVSTVGYALLRRIVTIAPQGANIEVLLGQEAVRQESVTVVAGVFDPQDPNAPSEHTLNNTELKNLAHVLLDDPLRSVQALPGVTTNDDFYAQFATRGSGFKHTGFFIDGVLTDQAFHTVQDENDSGSLTILNGDIIDSVSLLMTAPPARYGDRTGAVLNVRTRDGSRERISGRANIAATGLSYTGEGPLDPRGKLSVLGSFRMSYADWLIHRFADSPLTAVALGFTDGQLKLSYAASMRHQFSGSLVEGRSRADRERERASLGVNAMLTADMRNRVANAQWRWTGSKSLSVTEAYYAAGTGENHNVNGDLLFEAAVAESALRNDTTYRVARQHTIDAGFFVRHHLEEDVRRRFAVSTGFVPTDEFRVQSWQPGFYVQDTWNAWPGLTLTAGGRFDAYSLTGERVLLPRASLSWRVFKDTRISAGYGQYAQFPDFQSLSGAFGWLGLHAERSTHYVASIEHRLNESIRLRVEVYDKEERGDIFSVNVYPRMVGGAVTFPTPGPVLRNELRGYSRGMEVFLQRRSANRLSGWISYALGYSRFHDDAAGQAFDGDFDQRHTANLYASYRLTKSLNFSAKFRYGSAFPVVGYFAWAGQNLVLSEERNRLRPPQYSRLDVRVNRAFHFDRWKLTLYLEVANALRRRNIRLSDLDDVRSSGRVGYFKENLLPLLPSFGIGIEF